MPHYEQFKTYKNRRKTTVRNNNNTFTRMSSYSRMNNLRSNRSKGSAINPLIIKLAVIVLVISLVFGFLKSGFKDVSRMIKGSSNKETDISSIETSSGDAIRTDEQQMSILKDLTFRIFAKPEGDDSVIHEVTADDNSGNDYMSTLITRSALSYMTNNILTNGAELIDKDNLKQFFDKTSKKSSSDNRVVINDASAYIPKIEFSDKVNNDIANTLQNNNYNRVDTRGTSFVDANDVAENKNNYSSKSKNDDSSQNIIETRTFDKILSPKSQNNNGNNNNNNLVFVPAKSGKRVNRGDVNTKDNYKYTKDENKSPTQINNNLDKYFSDTREVVSSANKNNTDNNIRNININDSPVDKKNIESNILDNRNNEYQKNIAIENKNNIEKNNYNARNDTLNNVFNNTSKTSKPQNKNVKRSEIVSLDDVEKQNDIRNDDINKSTILEGNDNSSLKYTVDEKNNIDNIQKHLDTPNVQRDIKSNIERDVVPNNNWQININDKNKTDSSTKKRSIRRNSRLKPSIFLAQYDDKYGTITIIPKERDMGRDITVEKAIITLLDGSNEKEYNNNVISCISVGTALLDLFVDGDTVYLNFNSDFEHNPLGDEGIIIQIYQIVYTVTQFEGIDKVIFLIDGEQKETIGGEGQILNKVFTRMESEDIEVKN